MAAFSAESVRTLDLHGRTVYQARVAIEAALRRAGGCYRIRIIHGHIRGTALRDFVRGEYPNHPRVLRVVLVDESTTDLVLRNLRG